MSKERFFPISVDEAERTLHEMLDDQKRLYSKVATEHGWKCPPVSSEKNSAEKTNYTSIKSNGK